MRVLTAAEIRGLESCAVESGVSMETLMENAGAEVAAAVTEKMDVTGKKTVAALRSSCTARQAAR